jgi:hypothetical protein
MKSPMIHAPATESPDQTRCGLFISRRSPRTGKVTRLRLGGLGEVNCMRCDFLLRTFPEPKEGADHG